MEKKDYIDASMVEKSLANTPQITFEVTDACNLNCVYCGYGKLYSDYDNRENKMLKLDSATMFLDYMNKLWCSALNNSVNNRVYLSFYGGEPLLNMPFIKAIVKHVKNMDSTCKFMFNLTTNGLLLNRHIKYFVENDFHLLVSLDGDDKGNSYRLNYAGKSSSEIVISNIKSIQIKYPGYFKNRVNFNAVLHNRNSVESIVKFFKENFDKTPSIGSLNDMGIREDMKEEFIKMYKNNTDSLFNSENYSDLETELFLSSPTYHSATAFLMQNSDFKYENYNELLYGKQNNETFYPSGTCIPFSKKVFITVNGKILPCERIGHQFSIGKIEESFIDLNFEDIASKYNSYFAKIDKKCKKCKNQKGCIQCIFNLSDLTNEKCNCMGFMNGDSFKKYKNVQMEFFARHPEAYAKIMNEVIYR